MRLPPHSANGPCWLVSTPGRTHHFTHMNALRRELDDDAETKEQHRQVIPRIFPGLKPSPSAHETMESLVSEGWPAVGSWRLPKYRETTAQLLWSFWELPDAGSRAVRMNRTTTIPVATLPEDSKRGSHSGCEQMKDENTRQGGMLDQSLREKRAAPFTFGDPNGHNTPFTIDAPRNTATTPSSRSSPAPNLLSTPHATTHGLHQPHRVVTTPSSVLSDACSDTPSSRTASDTTIDEDHYRQAQLATPADAPHAGLPTGSEGRKETPQNAPITPATMSDIYAMASPSVPLGRGSINATHIKLLQGLSDVISQQANSPEATQVQGAEKSDLARIALDTSGILSAIRQHVGKLNHDPMSSPPSELLKLATNIPEDEEIVCTIFEFGRRPDTAAPTCTDAPLPEHRLLDSLTSEDRHSHRVLPEAANERSKSGSSSRGTSCESFDDILDHGNEVEDDIPLHSVLYAMSEDNAKDRRHCSLSIQHLWQKEVKRRTVYAKAHPDHAQTSVFLDSLNKTTTSPKSPEKGVDEDEQPRERDPLDVSDDEHHLGGLRSLIEIWTWRRSRDYVLKQLYAISLMEQRLLDATSDSRARIDFVRNSPVAHLRRKMDRGYLEPLENAISSATVRKKSGDATYRESRYAEAAWDYAHGLVALAPWYPLEYYQPEWEARSTGLSTLVMALNINLALCANKMGWKHAGAAFGSIPLHHPFATCWQAAKAALASLKSIRILMDGNMPPSQIKIYLEEIDTLQRTCKRLLSGGKARRDEVWRESEFGDFSPCHIRENAIYLGDYDHREESSPDGLTPKTSPRSDGNGMDPAEIRRLAENALLQEEVRAKMKELLSQGTGSTTPVVGLGIST